MNRTQYEKIHGKPEHKPCRNCELRNELRRRATLARHKKRKAFVSALARGVESGKVIQVWHLDEFTGWHYIDYKGQQGFTGSGGD